MATRVWFIVGAAALGIVVFVAAVLFTARPDIFSLASGASQCRAATAMAEAVEPHTAGAMAGFQTFAPKDITALPYGAPDAGGVPPTLADFKGRTILLNLWATWCAPCRVEMPHLAALHEEKGDDEFSVIAVSIDNRDSSRPEAFLAETDAEARAYYREPTLSLFNSLKDAGLLIGMPTTLLVAPDGCAAGVLHGAAEWHGEDAKSLVDAAVRSAGS